MMLWSIKVWKSFQQLPSSEFGFKSKGGNFKKGSTKKKKMLKKCTPPMGLKFAVSNWTVEAVGPHSWTISILVYWSVVQKKSDLRKHGSILSNRMTPPLLQRDKGTVWHPCSWQLWDDAHNSAPRRWTVHPASMLTVFHLSKRASEVFSLVRHEGSVTRVLMAESLAVYGTAWRGS